MMLTFIINIYLQLRRKKKLTNESITGILTIKTQPTISAKYIELANAETSADLSKMRTALSSLKTSQTASQLKLTPAQLQALITPAKMQKKDGFY